MRLLPDTSIWVDYLRAGAAGPAGALDDHLKSESVMVCGPVLAELMAGTKPEQRDELWLAVGALPWADIDRSASREMGEMASELRRSGRSVPLTDVAIAVACRRAEAILRTHDGDFERVQRVLPGLELRLET